MEFHTFQTHYQIMKSIQRRQGIRHTMDATMFWSDYVKSVASRDTLSVSGAAAQATWEIDRQPFYNVWPCVLPMLLKLDLSKLQSEFVTPVLPTLAVQLPVTGNPIGGPGYTVKSFLVTYFSAASRQSMKALAKDKKYNTAGLDYMPVPERFAGVPEGTRGFLFVIDTGETFAETMGVLRYSLRRFYLQDGCSIEQQMQQMAEINPSTNDGLVITEESIKDCVRLYCTLCLLDENSELINRIVLSADRLKYQQTNDTKFIKKAEQRGIHGWEIGRDLETVPHVRRPHFAIRWTGVGGTVPKVRPIKGSVVHRNKLLEVPTGYGADNPQT